VLAASADALAITNASQNITAVALTVPTIGASPLFKVTPSGTSAVLEWGSGAGAIDTNLYRSDVDNLKTDDSLTVAGSLNTGLFVNLPAAGTIVWGADTSLFRTAANTIKADGSLGSIRGLAANPAFTTEVTGDTVTRLEVSAEGRLEWGSGAAARDTNLYRSAPSVLKTDDALQAATVQPFGNVTMMATGAYIQRNATALTTTVFASRSATSISDAFTLAADGRHGWGPGDGSPTDVNLYRSATEYLKTDFRFGASLGILIETSTAFAAFRSRQSAANTVIHNDLTAADDFPAFRVFGDGKHEWGAGGALAADTNLYRSVANTLKTDDSLHVGNFSSTNAALQVHPAGTGTDSGYISMVSSRARFGYDGAGVAVRVDDGGSSKPIRFYSGIADNLVAQITTAGSLSLPLSVSAATALVLGGDTNLYRSAPDTLKTDDSFVIGGNIGEVSGTTPRLQFRDTDNADKIMLLVSNNGTLDLNEDSTAGANARLRIGGTGKTTVQVQPGTPGADVGITIGADTNLYRSAADTLKTDDSFHVAANLAHLGSNLGFFNTAATTKKTVTGSRATGAALTSLLTQLASYGLITDSSTA